jgi:hypothetical protein
MHHRSLCRRSSHSIPPAFLVLLLGALLGSVALTRPASAQTVACLDLDQNGYCDDTGALIVDNAFAVPTAPTCASDADCADGSFCYQVACACWDGDGDGLCDSGDSGEVTKGGGTTPKPRMLPGSESVLPDVECPGDGFSYLGQCACLDADNDGVCDTDDASETSLAATAAVGPSPEDVATFESERSLLAPDAVNEIIANPEILWSETATTASSPTLHPKFGVILEATLEYDAAVQQAIVDAHLGFTRLHGYWRFIELVQGGCSLPNPTVQQCDWRKLDQNVNDAVNRGLGIYIGIGFWPPAWANNSAGCNIFADRCTANPPTNPLDFKNFVKALVNRYKNRVGYFAIWNEPDFPEFWNGDYTRYVKEILIPGADSVHAAFPAGQVIGPEISTSNTKLQIALSMACAKLDIISVHLFRDTPDQDINKLKNEYIPSIRRWCGTKPLWVTAFGWDSAKVPQATQAQYLKDTFVKLNAISDVKKIIFYDMVDGGVAKFGLLKTPAEGFARKPSFTSIEAYLRSIP